MAKGTELVPHSPEGVSAEVRDGLEAVRGSITEARQALALVSEPIDMAPRTFSEMFMPKHELTARRLNERTERIRHASQILDERVALANRVGAMAEAAVKLENLSRGRETARLKAEIGVLTLTQERLRLEEEVAVFAAEREHREAVRNAQRAREIREAQGLTSPTESAADRVQKSIQAERLRLRAELATDEALIAAFIQQAEEVFVDSAISDTERMLKLRALLGVYGRESADLPPAVRDFLQAEEAKGV